MATKAVIPSFVVIKWYLKWRNLKKRPAPPGIFPSLRAFPASVERFHSKPSRVKFGVKSKNAGSL